MSVYHSIDEYIEHPRVFYIIDDLLDAFPVEWFTFEFKNVNSFTITDKSGKSIDMDLQFVL